MGSGARLRAGGLSACTRVYAQRTPANALFHRRVMRICKVLAPPARNGARPWGASGLDDWRCRGCVSGSPARRTTVLAHGAHTLEAPRQTRTPRPPSLSPGSQYADSTPPKLADTRGLLCAPPRRSSSRVWTSTLGAPASSRRRTVGGPPSSAPRGGEALVSPLMGRGANLH